jgi:hypothetical protein
VLIFHFTSARGDEDNKVIGFLLENINNGYRQSRSLISIFTSNRPHNELVNRVTISACIDNFAKRIGLGQGLQLQKVLVSAKCCN